MEQKKIDHLGEFKIIRYIENLIFKKTGRKLIRDDCFFFSLKKNSIQDKLVLNSDMFVSTTDAPRQMSFWQIGRKSVLMNISDLMVKGVKPTGIIISLGLPKDLSLHSFEELMNGIIDYCKKWNLEYIGGDINKTQELIISPTIFGFKNPKKIIYRSSIESDDILVINEKFGLTGVGFDILIRKNGNLYNFPKYKRSMLSVLEPSDPGNEGCILADYSLATSSIDSSDGLVRSIGELTVSNPHIGFEIEFGYNLIDNEAKEYSEEYNVPLESLVFEGGEEYTQIFTINPKNLEHAQEKVKEQGGKLYRIGKVISEKKIYFKKNNSKFELKSHGYNHFI